MTTASGVILVLKLLSWVLSLLFPSTLTYFFNFTSFEASDVWRNYGELDAMFKELKVIFSLYTGLWP